MPTNAQARIQSEELKAFLDARCFAYQLLQKTFVAEPERGYVLSLTSSGLVQQFPFRHENALIEQGVAEADGYLSDPANSSLDAFETLHWDYTRLCVGPNRLAAPPWESAYLNPDRLLFQQETLEVRAAYLEYCFIAPEFPHEPDDHIGFELDFMQQTSQLAAARAEQGDGDGLVAVCRDQLRFLDQHLLKWAPAFAADIVANAQTGFYRGMARVLEGFLRVDREVLTELLQEAADA